jgi:hypothetical protein
VTGTPVPLWSEIRKYIGVGPAFVKWGSADAMNMGRLAAFTMSAAEIGKDIGGPNPNEPGTIKWKADHVIASSSGDLGVSIGYIRQKGDASAPGSPFFTVWRKGADGKWKREYYTMVNGGATDGTIRDSDQDKIKFVAVATVLAQHLARQGY